MKEKLYIVRKYIMAESALDAIKKDKQSKVDDVWLDDDFRKAEIDKGTLGFNLCQKK
jgi:hypothetical protein